MIHLDVKLTVMTVTKLSSFRSLVGKAASLFTSALPVLTTSLPVISPATWSVSAGAQAPALGPAATCA